MWPLWLIVIAGVVGVAAAFWFTRVPRPPRHRRRPLPRQIATSLLEDANPARTRKAPREAGRRSP